MASLEKLMEQSEKDKEDHLAAQRHYQAVSAGLSSNQDGQAASLNNQLMGRLLCFMFTGPTNSWVDFSVSC